MEQLIKTFAFWLNSFFITPYGNCTFIIVAKAQIHLSISCSTLQSLKTQWH